MKSNEFKFDFAEEARQKKEVLKRLVRIRMNEIFPCLACYGQKLKFLFGNRDKDKLKIKMKLEQCF